jgi:RNA polymerase sigma-70 factor (sigma-E family)
MTSNHEDDEAFRDFVHTRRRSLVGTAWLVTADRHIAEDCVQDALVGVHRHWARLRRDGNPEAYARRAAINSALSWRRRRRIAEVPVENLPDIREAAARDDALDPDLVAALRSLPPRMRAVVALRFVEDRSEAETADLLGCSLGTVKSSTHRGLAKLRAALTDAAPSTSSTRFTHVTEGGAR